MRTMSRGDRGDDVKDVQTRLAALGYQMDPEEHGVLGPSTEQALREFQQRRGLLVDGRVGPITWEELVEAGYATGDRVLYLRYPFYRGDDVRTLQARLNLLGFDAGRGDGIFGERADRAVREFQRNVGLPADGIVGGTTLDALDRLRPVSATGPGRATVREGEALLRLSASLDGARIAVDAGHGPGDPGATGPAGATEAELAFRIAERVVEELGRRGARPFLTRGADEDLTPSARARAANAEGAEALVSIHLNSHRDPSAEGASTFYFGREDWVSQSGMRLADLIQDALTTQLGLKDGRIHPMALPILRETAMPAVQVEPCFVTNPREERLAVDPQFHARVATAIATGVEAFFGRVRGADATSGDADAAPGR